MATTISIKSTGVTLDEKPGFQTDDNDVALNSLPTPFFDELFGTDPGQLGLDTSFASSIGAAWSGPEFVTVSGGTVDSLTLTGGDSGGNIVPLTTYAGDPSAGLLAPIKTTGGEDIYLFADDNVPNMVLGYDASGNVALAAYMDTNLVAGTAQIWTVQLEPLQQDNLPDTPDDGVDLGYALQVATVTSLHFSFDNLPSGQNLFGTVGTTDNAIVVVGSDAAINSDGSTAAGSDTINTSHGGGAVTIGVNNQMFDPGEGAYFTYVTNPDPDYLAGAPGGLTQTEADNANNIQFGGVLETAGASATISQTQGNRAATLVIKAYDGAYTDGTGFIDALGTGSLVAVDTVTVENAAGNPAPGVTVDISGGVATVSGVRAGDTVHWTTDGLHDRVLISDATGDGKFDIGAFAIDQADSAHTNIGSYLTFEDSGPTITASTTDEPSLTVSEATLLTPASATFSGQFTKDFGTDGPATSNATTYALQATDGTNSGLVDTATKNPVFLFLESGAVVGREGTDSTAAATGHTVFTVSVDGTGQVTLTQDRAVVQPDATNPDTGELVGLSGSDKVVLSATIEDGDGDQAGASLDLTALLNFADVGPSIAASTAGEPTLTADEASLGTPDSGSYSGQFTPTYNADGAAASAPLTYALQATDGTNSGLVDTATKNPVFLFLESGAVVGREGTDSTAAATGHTVFTVSVDGTGQVTLTQDRAVVQPDATSPDKGEMVGLSGSDKVVLSATATDGDGDQATATLDLTPQLLFKDTGPTIGSIASSTVDFATGAAGTTGPVTLNGVVGADTNPAPYTLVSFNEYITAGTLTFKGVLSGDKETVSYYAAGTDGVFGTADDIKYYQLSLNETDFSGAGSYTFTVLQEPPEPELEFDLSSLPSGQNLFGTVGDASGTEGFVVFGKDPTLNPDGTYAHGSDTINTSQGGGATTIGVNNQMFDPGEGAYFTFVTDPGTALTSKTADDADNIRYSGLFGANEAQAQIAQTQGNSPASLTITAYDASDPTDGRQMIVQAGSSGTEVAITGVEVYNKAGELVATSDGSVTDPTIGFEEVGGAGSGVWRVSGLLAGDTFAWETETQHDQVLISDDSGKFDIGGFSIIQHQPTPAQDLPFMAQATDGDGDYAQASFNVHINPVLVS